MIRVYISGPIAGDKDYKKKFEKVEENLRDSGLEVVNPAGLDYAGLNRERILNLDLEFLKLCDTIYMLKGWEKSCGACMEYGFAKGTGKAIYYQEDEEE